MLLLNDRYLHWGIRGVWGALLVRLAVYCVAVLVRLRRDRLLGPSPPPSPTRIIASL
jgi:hypothetical protein